MKNLSTLICIHLFTCVAFAQQVVNTTVSNNQRMTDKVSISMKPGFHVKAGSNTKFRAFIDSSVNGIPDYLEAYLPSLGENYIKTTECLNTSCSKKKETIVYFDGLGREKQLLQVAASPTGKNIVTPFEYDGFGRQAKDFLPFPVQSSSSKISTETDGSSFYANLTGDTTPYSEKTFENSPLNRILSQAAPGSSWRKGNGHEIEFDYQTNKNGEVLRFDVKLDNSYVPSLVPNGSYSANTLYKTITTDENGQPIQEFKDKEGRLILKRIDIPEMLFNSFGNHDTYYVYDIYGNLTYVLPPKLVEVGDYVKNLAELGYQYQYDEKNRLVEKQLPGKGREYMVYDKQDRLVAAQDALQREKGGFYTFMQYDKFGRLVVQGQHPEPGVSRNDLQNHVNGLGANNVERISGPYRHSGLDIYYSRAYGGDQSSSIFTTVNYYDNYDNLGVNPFSIDNQSVVGQKDLKTQGLTVASFTNVLGTRDWNKAYTFYDTKYVRSIASASINYLGGHTNSASTLDFRGKVLSTVTKHKLDNQNSNEITVKETFDYYENELLKSQTHQVNNNPVEYLTQNTYNEINQLTSKKVGNNNASSPLQTVGYKYNIRGWMTDINNVDNDNKLFAFRIGYNQPKNTKGLYNGNISEVIWKTFPDHHTKSYSYSYDGLNRLLKSIYSENENGFNEIKNTYNEKINGYDKNGNILGIERNGVSPIPNNPLIDDLTYDYPSNSNKLVNVTDTRREKGGFHDGNKYSGTNLSDKRNDYVYDINGNLKKDLNKGIIDIQYNHLNLPIEVLWNASKKINYVYDSSGAKLRKIVIDGATITTTDYAGGFQYKKDGNSTLNQLQFFPTAEGYVNVTNGNSFNYVYNYTDHLGNIRLSYQKETNGSLTVLEENNFYPFGLKHSGYDGGKLGNQNYNYKYQGQERQDELGLNWDSFKWRNYMPDIGRFFNIDPLAEDYVYNGVYNFSENRVIDGRELEGLERVGMHLLEKLNDKNMGLNSISNNRTLIAQSSQKYNVSSQAIASIIYQEKSAGIRGDLANIYAKNFKKNGTTSLGLGEIQVNKVAELRGLDANNDFDKIVSMLEDSKISIDLIAENIVDMQNFIGRELSIMEITYGHNAGKENLKKAIDNGDTTANRVSVRSLGVQDEINKALNGQVPKKSTIIDIEEEIKKEPLHQRIFHQNRGSKL